MSMLTFGDSFPFQDTFTWRLKDKQLQDFEYGSQQQSFGAVSGLPIMWENHIPESRQPYRLSSHDQMMHQIAEVFTEFAKEQDRPTSENLKSIFKRCHGPWDKQERNVLKLSLGYKREEQITSLCTKTIEAAVEGAFDDLVEHDTRFSRLKEADEVYLGFSPDLSPPNHGQADRILTIGSRRGNIETQHPVCWIDYKSPGATEKNRDGMVDLISRGAFINWQAEERSMDMPERMIRKGAYYTGLPVRLNSKDFELEFGFFTSHRDSIMLRLVPNTSSTSSYLACSRFSRHGEPLSANIIPAMLSIVTATCFKLGFIDNYPPLPHSPLLPSDPFQNKQDEYTESSYEESDSSSKDSTYQSQNAAGKRKRARKAVADSSTSPESALDSSNLILHTGSKVQYVLGKVGAKLGGEREVRDWPDSDPLDLTTESYLGSGNLGEVYRCKSKEGDLMAVKIVEGVEGSEKRRAIQSEWLMYERLMKDGLADKVIPHCYGLYEQEYFAALLLELCGDTIEDFNTLSIEERKAILEVIQALHLGGYAHEDFEPRNVVRHLKNGISEMRIIDLENVKKHNCPLKVRDKAAPLRRQVFQRQCNTIVRLAHALNLP